MKYHFILWITLISFLQGTMGTVNLQTSVLTAFLFLSTLFTYAFERTTSKRLNPNDKYTPKFGQITTETRLDKYKHTHH